MPSPTHLPKQWLKKYEKPQVKWSQTGFFALELLQVLGASEIPKWGRARRLTP